MATLETRPGRTIPAGTWNVDPAHSTIRFEVEDLSDLFATISGRFTDFEGTIEAGEDPESVKASGVIRTASVTTDQEQRDAHLRSPDFFDAASFPEIRFESDRVELAGETLRIVGTLTMKGVGQRVELEGRLLGQGTDSSGNERIVFDGAGEIGFGPMTVKIAVNVSAAKAG